ncbi:hypothetical protein ACVIW2_006248 [Bradyrhizobium huanghuaihaiense]
MAVLCDAAHDDVDVGVLGVPVIDPHPVELGTQIHFHLADQFAGETLEVGHVRRVLGGDDEAEMVAVILTALGEGLGIGILGARAEQVGLLPVPGHAFAPEIAEMRRERRRPRPVPDDPGLDGHQTRAAGEQTVCPHAGGSAAAEARMTVADELAGSRNAAASALSGGKRLGDEGLGPLAPRGADAAGPWLKIAVFSHGQPRQCAECRIPATG